jgi:hypothetical protein
VGNISAILLTKQVRNQIKIFLNLWTNVSDSLTVLYVYVTTYNSKKISTSLIMRLLEVVFGVAHYKANMPESETLVQRFKKIFIIILFCLCLWIKKKEIKYHFEQTIYLID